MSSQHHPRFWMIVPAAGKGSRFGSEVPKQYLELAGAPLAQHTISRLLEVVRIERVLVAIASDDQWWPRLPQARDPRVQTVAGGSERAWSVLNALAALEHDARVDDWILVHDMARPCVSTAHVQKLMDELQDHPVGGILALPVNDTVKRCNDGGDIIDTVPRDHLWLAQTPQMFRYGLLRSALERGLALGAAITDEASAVEIAGYAPQVVVGDVTNIKVTRPEDLRLAAVYLQMSGE